MREQITITLTRDQLTAILQSLETYDYDRLKLWQLDEFDTGSDKADFISRIEDDIQSVL